MLRNRDTILTNKHVLHIRSKIDTYCLVFVKLNISTIIDEPFNGIQPKETILQTQTKREV